MTLEHVAPATVPSLFLINPSKEKSIMSSLSFKARCAALAFALTLGQTTAARAQSEASIGLSRLPLVSAVAVVSASATASIAVISVPVILSSAGATFVIKAIDASAAATVYVFERSSDGVRISLKVSGQGLKASSELIGTAVAVTVLATGVMIILAGEVLAFVPNAIGQTLLHNQQLAL